MLKFKQYLLNEDNRCWTGYEPTPGKEPYSKGSCQKIEELEEAEYQGKQVTLNKPFRTPGGPKKFAVYVKDGDKIKIVRFGDPNMEIRRDNPNARRSYRARHGCEGETDKTTANYWSCKMWSSQKVSDLTESRGDVIIKEISINNKTLGLLRSFEGDYHLYAYIGKPGEYNVASNINRLQNFKLSKPITNKSKALAYLQKAAILANNMDYPHEIIILATTK